MSIRVRADLLAVAERVASEFGKNDDGTIGRAQIEAAIAAQAAAPVAQRPFSEDESACVLRLRSQAFKAPDKKLRLA